MTPAPEGGIAARTRARHADIHAALARGLTVTETSRAVGPAPKSVQRCAAAATAYELIGGARLARPGLLDPHLSYLRQRWDGGSAAPSGCMLSCAPCGYQGSLRTLRRLTATLRRDSAVPARPPAPAVRKAASWILIPPDDLAASDRAALKQITARCEEFDAEEVSGEQVVEASTSPALSASAHSSRNRSIVCTRASKVRIGQHGTATRASSGAHLTCIA